MRTRLAAVLLALLLTALHRPAVAQETAQEAALENFIGEVAGFWQRSEVAALIQLIPEDDPFLLDAGGGMEFASSRNAAAALRALFAEHETIAVQTVGATVAGADPSRGFGELSWTFRVRGAPGEQSRVVYVAARQDDGSWQITELRLMP